MLGGLSTKPSALKVFQGRKKQTKKVCSSTSLGPVNLPLCGVIGSRGYCGLAKVRIVRLPMSLPELYNLLAAYC